MILKCNQRNVKGSFLAHSLALSAIRITGYTDHSVRVGKLQLTSMLQDFNFARN